MDKDLSLETVLAELSRAGVSVADICTEGKHTKVVWQGKEKRTVVVAKTASDTRAHLNARAEVRRQLRDDGLLPPSSKPIRRPVNKPPRDLEPVYDRLEVMEAEARAFTDLMLEAWPALKNLASIEQQPTQVGDFALRLEVPAERLGPILAALGQEGVPLSKVRMGRIQPKVKEQPPKVEVETVAETTTEPVTTPGPKRRVPLHEKLGYSILKRAIRKTRGQVKLIRNEVAKDAHVSSSQIDLLLKEMIEQGELEVVKEATRGNPGIYRLTI